MINLVKKTIDEYKMINSGEKVIVAVSGGPDSICLLDILNNLKEEYSFDIIASHVNHCIRGEEANKDEEYVRQYCESKDIEFYSVRKDVEKIAKERGISSEMAGREERYAFFEKLFKEHNADKIALAHNSNDLAETVLMRIMRGTGLEGLEGIKPIRDEIYIRPILYNTRSEIEKYCSDEKLNPRIDKTNNENIYSRNKVRLELIPYIKENFNKDIINTVNRLASNARIDNDYFNMITVDKFKKYCKINKFNGIIDEKMFQEHDALVTRILRKALFELSGSTYNFERKHIYDIIQLQKNISGKSINLPQNIVCFNEYGNIRIKINLKDKKDEEREYKLYIGNENNIEQEGISFNLKSYKKENIDIMNKNKHSKYFDLDKIKGPIILRYKKPGDKIVPLGMTGSKKLKKIFNENKVPVHDRENIPLICFNDDIAWVLGYVISDKYKIDKHTKNILEICLIKGGK